jgi:hypothetical protein
MRTSCGAVREYFSAHFQTSSPYFYGGELLLDHAYGLRMKHINVVQFRLRDFGIAVRKLPVLVFALDGEFCVMLRAFQLFPDIVNNGFDRFHFFTASNISLSNLFCSSNFEPSSFKR